MRFSAFEKEFNPIIIFWRPSKRGEAMSRIRTRHNWSPGLIAGQLQRTFHSTEMRLCPTTVIL